MFGVTAGRQCACNALYSIAWSVAKRISQWKSFDLDHIIMCGDRMYKSLKIGNVDELPREIYMYGYTMRLSISEANLHEGVVLLREPFLRNIFYSSDSSNKHIVCLLFINSYTISIIPGYARDGMYNSSFLFDSHCRNRRDVTDSPIGFSLLMQFPNWQEIEKYILR